MDREQFITRVESTQKAFRRFLVALCCGNTPLADDIAQESYMKAWLACDTVADAEKFNAWLFRIGYTTFINHKRSERAFADYEEARRAPAAETSDAAFRYQELYAALNSLPDRERTSVLLHYMQGYAVKEIAEIVEISPDAVRQHLSRGRARLRGLLSPQ